MMQNTNTPNSDPQKNTKKPSVPRTFIKDDEGNYDIDGVSLAPEGVVVSGDKHTPTEENENEPNEKISLKDKKNQPSPRDHSSLGSESDESKI